MEVRVGGREVHYSLHCDGQQKKDQQIFFTGFGEC